MATIMEIDAARMVLDTFVKSADPEMSRARAQLILEAAERARARSAQYEEDERMGRTI